MNLRDVGTDAPTSDRAAFKLKFLDGFAFLLADASEFFSLGDLSELPNE